MEPKGYESGNPSVGNGGGKKYEHLRPLNQSSCRHLQKQRRIGKSHRLIKDNTLVKGEKRKVVTYGGEEYIMDEKRRIILGNVVRNMLAPFINHDHYYYIGKLVVMIKGKGKKRKERYFIYCGSPYYSTELSVKGKHKDVSAWQRIAQEMIPNIQDLFKENNKGTLEEKVA